MAQKTAVNKKWTFMVYLAGDNDLDQNGVIDLGEMKKVGSNDNINIIAEFDRAGKKKETKRFYLRKGGTLAADEVMNLGETNTGDPKSLIDFAGWGIKNYPAERYALILWNHGQGWDDTDIYASDRFRAVQRLARGRIRHSFFLSHIHEALVAAANSTTEKAILLDDNAKDFLDNIEMKKALAAIKKTLGRKIDLLGMDACLMNMAEIAYQIRSSVQFAVGSEQTEPLEGWPYDTILSELAKNPAMSSKEFSEMIVDKYIASYSLKDVVTQSSCDLSKSESMAGSVKGLALALSNGLSSASVKQAIMQARVQAQSYDVPDNIDLVDFCKLLQNIQGIDKKIITACQKVIDAVTGAKGIVIKSGFKGAGVKNSYGLAAYFPTTTVSPLYANLDFTKKTGWGAFLDKYLTELRKR